MVLLESVRTGPMEKGSGRSSKGPGSPVSIRTIVQEQERAKEDIAPHLLLPHPARASHWANLTSSQITRSHEAAQRGSAFRT